MTPLLRDLTRRARTDERGFTLVELMVAMLVFAIVMTIAVALFLSILRHQTYSNSTAEANNSAQLAMKQLEYDIRNAAWATTAKGGDVLIMASRVATDADPSAAQCIAYFYDENTSELRRSASTSNTVTAAVNAASTVGEVRTLSADWAVSVDEASPIGTRIFGVTDETVSYPEDVQVNLSVATVEGRDPVELSKQISLRYQSDLALACK